MKKLLIAVGVLLGIGVLAALAVANKGSAAGREVRTEKVARRDLVAIVTASGKVEPKRKVDISADIPGRVIQLAVEEGQWVNRGDLLLRIDPSQYEAAVRQAEATVAQARAREAEARAQLLKAEGDQRRAEQLAQGRDLIAAQEVDNARTQAQVAQASLQGARFGVQQAQATLSQARDNLRKTTIVAPMAGRVTRLNIHEGETAIIGTMNNPGSLLLTVADLSVMEAKVKVDETEVPRIAVGDSAVLRIDAFPGQTFTGKVTRIGNSAAQGSGLASSTGSGGDQAVDFEVVVTLDHPPAELRPDLSATAEIVTDQRAKVLSVPILSVTVRDRQGKKFKGEEQQDAAQPDAPAQGEARNRADEVEGVFVLRAGKATWVPVTVGVAGEQYFEVKSGVKEGDEVVSGPFDAIRELEADTPIHAAAAQPAGGRRGARGGGR
ncbi:MAG: efflux RND transporter periplasmic adaptor subunit [Longimicrobiaceae bacterium]